MIDIVNIDIHLKFLISTDESLIINNILVILYHLLIIIKTKSTEQLCRLPMLRSLITISLRLTLTLIKTLMWNVTSDLLYIR